MVVGRENGCAYNGQAYFDLSPVSSDNSIVSATLRLYTPNQVGSTGVTISPNGMGSAEPAQPVSWSTAPPIMTGTAPLSQSASNGHWQSWDVTSIVRQWVQDGSTNAGLTLTSAGVPTRFASALGAGTATDPTLTPYLDISYASSISGTTTNATTAAATPAPGPYNDKARVIYGDSGAYTADDPTLAGNGDAAIYDAGNATVKPPCTTNGVTCGNGDFRISASRFQLQSQFVRFGIQLPCSDFQTTYGIDPTMPGARWWGSDDQRPVSPAGAPPVDASRFNIGDLSQLVTSARAWGSTPVINVLPGDTCVNYNRPKTTPKPITRLSPPQWYAAVQNLVAYLNTLAAFNADKSKPVYFEIGNEPSLTTGPIAVSGQVGKYTDGSSFTSTDGTYHYEDIFAYAARGLNQALANDGYSTYRILTAGMYAPTAALQPKACQTQVIKNADSSTFTVDSYDTVFASGQAIAGARYAPPVGFVGPNPYPGPTVPGTHLGVAVHPYSYDTSEKSTTTPRYWKNYYSQKLGAYAGPCQNLSFLISTWEGGHANYGDRTKRYWHDTYNFAGLPVVFTEDNYSPVGGSDVAEAAYLADLFTYLYINSPKTARSSGPIDPTRTRLRVLWFRGVNALSDPIGLFYGPTGANGTVQGDLNGMPKPMPKTVTLYCPKAPGILKGTMPQEFSSLTTTGCYR